MGTTKIGRYLNTQGSSRKVSDFALVHSNEGRFVFPVMKKGKTVNSIRLKSGGHGQKGMELLNKYHIPYKVIKTYKNGVRVGNVPSHSNKRKRDGNNQAWFPSNWTDKDIRRTGEHVAGLKRNRYVRDGKAMWGIYKGVRVGVKKTNGKIATVFPDKLQPSGLRNKKKGNKSCLTE